MSSKVVGIAGAAASALFALVPPAQASPVIQGSMETSGSGSLSSCKLATCAPFFAAGCPEGMAKPDGVTTSIVDVSGLGGRRLTFTWSAATNPALDSKVFFSVVESCTAPVGASFAITNAEQSKPWTIPLGAKWLIVESDYAQKVAWSAS